MIINCICQTKCESKIYIKFAFLYRSIYNVYPSINVWVVRGFKRKWIILFDMKWRLYLLFNNTVVRYNKWINISNIFLQAKFTV